MTIMCYHITMILHQTIKTGELIRNAVRILCQTFSGTDVDRKYTDDIVLSGVRKLAQTFNVGGEKTGACPNKPKTLRDLHSVSHNIGNDKETRELHTFATTLEDGYILCQ